MRNWNYTRIFGNRKNPLPSDEDIRDLVYVVSTYTRKGPAGKKLRAGYTYFGQFIDHDLSHLRQNVIPSYPAPLGLDDLTLGRKPALDLDSVYGGGLSDSVVPYYREDGKFILGKTKQGLARDLPRDPNHQPLIADHRNDENMLVAQIHVLFMNLHNRIIDEVSKSKEFRNKKAHVIFEEARKQVILIYQYLVLHDFSEKLLPSPVYDNIIKANKGRLSIPSRDNPTISLEFAAAAYRLHSLVRNSYFINEKTRLDLKELFIYTGRNKDYTSDLFPLDSAFLVDWTFYFTFSRYSSLENTNAQKAKALSQILAKTMTSLFVNTQQNRVNMMKRNITRSNDYKIASGQQIYDHLMQKHKSLAVQMGLKKLSEIPLANSYLEHLARVSPNNSILQHTPLWIYIMWEANTHELGTLGGWIVADTFRTAAKNSDIRLPNIHSSDPLQLFDPLLKYCKIKQGNKITIDDVIVYTYDLLNPKTSAKRRK